MTNSSVTTKMVLSIAFQAFATQGYKALTMRSLANKCGMTVSSLYHHFPSKNDLYESVLDTVYSDNSKYWSSPIETKGGTWQEQLEDYIYNFCRIIHGEKGFVQLMKREQLDANPGRMKKLAQTLLASEYSGFKRLIQKVNPDCEAHTYVMVILGMALHYYETREFRRYLPDYALKLDDPAVVSRQITNILIGGIAYSGGLK